MTPTRAAAYLGCAMVSVAWLASAAGVGHRRAVPEPEPQPVQSTGTETLADDVQAQAVRLQQRLAAAPAPRRSARNPFTFASRPSLPVRVPTPREPASPPPAPVLPEPVLLLVGVAADQSAEGLVRTAIITAEGGELFIVRNGDFIGARYRIESIGADAVELSDRTNGTLRRLVLR